jgi:hypothetical protein
MRTSEGAGAAAGTLHMKDRIDIGRADRRELDAYLSPIDLEFLGNQHRL